MFYKCLCSELFCFKIHDLGERCFLDLNIGLNTCTCWRYLLKGRSFSVLRLWITLFPPSLLPCPFQYLPSVQCNRRSLFGLHSSLKTLWQMSQMRPESHDSLFCFASCICWRQTRCSLDNLRLKEMEVKQCIAVGTREVVGVVRRWKACQYFLMHKTGCFM